jgi:hypothetical protein
VKESTAQASSKPAVLSLAQLLAEQPPAPPPGWIEPGLLPSSGILFVGGEPKVGKSLLASFCRETAENGDAQSNFGLRYPIYFTHTDEW